MKVDWLDEPEEHDYPAALDYLFLLVGRDAAENTVAALRAAEVATRLKAKDILRASRLEHLPADNAHVAKDLRKAKGDDKLSPILLVRFPDRLEIADGYHRTCAVYHLDEDAEIPCKIVTLSNN